MTGANKFTVNAWYPGALLKEKAAKNVCSDYNMDQRYTIGLGPRWNKSTLKKWERYSEKSLMKTGDKAKQKTGPEATGTTITNTLQRDTSNGVGKAESTAQKPKPSGNTM